MGGHARMTNRVRNRAHVFCGAASTLLAIPLALTMAWGAVAGERSLTVDDLLKLSHVGNAIAQPGRDVFVWEQSPPYDTLSDYGAGSTGTWQGSDFEIFSVGPGTSVPKKLFQPPVGTTYRLGSFSPDGRYLTLLSMREGEVRLAVYDFQLRRLKEFPLAPRFLALQPEPDWAWLDSRRLAVAACPTGGGPWPLTFRREIGKHLTESWAKSWKGKEASVDQYDSSSSDSIRPLPGRLVIVDMVSGHIRELSTGQFSGLHPSSDGRWLAAVRQSALPQSAIDQPHLDWTSARSSLILFSLSTLEAPLEVASELDVLPDSIVWNPSSKRLAVYASHGGAGLRNGDFWIVDPATSAVTRVPHLGLSLVSQRVRGGPQWPERAVWVGDSLAVFAHSTPGESGTMSFEDIKGGGNVDPRVAVSSMPAHWYLLRSNSAPRDLTPGMQSVSSSPIIADRLPFIVLGDGQAWRLDASAAPVRLFPESTRQLHPLAYQTFISTARTQGGGGIVAISGGSESLAQVALKDGMPTLRTLRTPPATTVRALSDSGAALVQAGAGKGAELAVMHIGGTPMPLGELNPILDGIAETRWTDFNYANLKDSTRAQLSGCLLLPSNYRSGSKYPMIVEVYPGRSGGCAAPEARHVYAMGAAPASYSEHLLAAKGFIVFKPDTGADISRSIEGPQALLSTVVDQGIDAVLAAGFGDPTRLGLLGFSQGGFASLWIATQSSRYKAVVSLNGWSDLVTSFFGMNWTQQLAPTEISPEGDMGRYMSSAGSSFNMGGTPWQFPQRYTQNSPLWRSDSVSAPVLLIHSDMDVFDVESYKAFFSSLYTQKKDARLLIYRGEGHSPSSPANIRDMWNNIFAWFDTYLRIKRDAVGKMILGE
jgi:dipeptidyl aminopeptidase/acylaminoacyl peptidase